MSNKYDLSFRLLNWQKLVLTSTKRFKVVVAGRRCGKSRLACVLLLIKGLECPPGSHVLYCAPTQGQARTIIWQMLLDLGYGVITGSHVNNMEVYLPNGTIIYIRGADRPDTLRGGDLYYVVIDEYADIKPIVWEQVLRASLARHKGGALFIGTPRGRNHFYDIYQLGQDGDDEEWGSWHFTTKDNELIDPDEIAAAKKTLSSFSFKQEYLASFDNAGTDLFKESWLKYGEEPKQGSYYIAIDLAGFEAVGVQAGNKKSRLDQTAISVVKLTDEGKWFVKKIEHGRWDVRENAVRILKNIRDFKPIGIGIEKGALFNAVMPYLTDLMRKNNLYAHIQPLSHGNVSKGTNSANDRIVWALQGMFEHGRIILNKDEDWDTFKDQYLMYPTKGVHDDCFPADAPIITEKGIKLISEITIDDYVLTRNGYRKVLKAWCKGSKQVITRYGITATPDHKVWTENQGWVNLDSLRDDDIIIVSQPVEVTSCAKQSSSMEENITATQTQNKIITDDITQAMILGEKPQEHCIEIYGNSTMEKYQKDTTYTTLTETSTITVSPILFASQVQHIKWSIEKKEAKEQRHQNTWLTYELSGRLLTSGIKQKNVEIGQENTQRNQSSKIGLKNNAMSVVLPLSQKYQTKSSVAINAEMIGRQESQEKSVPVYDLMVEGDHEFFAYGVLVHNCIDSLSYISQMAITTYLDPDDEVEEWEPLDIISGM